MQSSVGGSDQHSWNDSAMPSTSTGADQNSAWNDSTQTVKVDYQQMEGTLSFSVDASSDSSMATQYANLSALQNDFVAIQPLTEGYQQVFLPGQVEAFESLPADLDYVITRTGDLTSLRVLDKSQSTQVPFILTDQSQTSDTGLTLSGGTQYCLNLGAYMHNFDGSIAPTVATSDTTLMSTQGLSASTQVQLLQMGLSNMFTTRDTTQPPPSYNNLQNIVQDTSLQLLSSTSVTSSLGIKSGQPSMASTGAQQVIGVVGPLIANEDDQSNLDGSDAAAGENAEHQEVRKSERIAHRERSPSPVEVAQYCSKPYHTTELWCEDCQTSYAEECTKHKLHPVNDKIVLSRAWASLPPQLQIFRLSESTGEQASELGVFAKKLIPKRTQFGPFVAPTVKQFEDLTARKFLLMVDKDSNCSEYIDAANEDRCNWMMFVRPAMTFVEQNLVAYQHGNEIFFTAIKNIDARQELKVWYAAHYAERLNLQLLSKPSDAPVVDETELSWPCYECSERFRTSALLQKHLTVHDDDPNALDPSANDDPDDPECCKQRGLRRGRRKGRRSAADVESEQNGNTQPETTSESQTGTGESEFQSWKKRKTNMYLRMKKYKEPIKRSIRTLARRSRFGAIGVECPICDALFENAALLQIHALSHVPATNVDTSNTAVGGDVAFVGETSDSATGVSLPVAPAASVQTSVTCPSCQLTFEDEASIVTHVMIHVLPRRNRVSVRTRRPFRCTCCWKSFDIEEKLKQHLVSHADNMKPLVCEVCHKRFMNNSALACHMKTHSESKYYTCPLCHEGFDQIHVLRSHADRHADPNTGMFSCPWCHKSFDSFGAARRHARSFHSHTYSCTDCGKTFPRPDKLKLHQLRHSSHREFMCETCGRQFKRKDKLREHVRRIHPPGNKDGAESKLRRVVKAADGKFAPKVPPSDYQLFIYKCHDCQLGFKRRGMLVNHLAKRHPDVAITSVPELNLPILKSTRDYYCQYCDKVYKSSAKRKSHILKSHPGAELPAGARRRMGVSGTSSESSLPNPTYSATVGSVMTTAHACDGCHKQYASKAKLLQHQRKKHGSQWDAANRRRVGPMAVAGTATSGDFIVESGNATASKLLTAAMISRCLSEGGEIQIIPQGAVDGTVIGELTDADLLTQAMTELTQSFGSEYRVVTAGGSTNLQTVVPCVVNVSNATALVQSIAVSGANLTPQRAVLQKGPGQAQILHTMPRSLASTTYAQQRAVNVNWNVSANGTYQTF